MSPPTTAWRPNPSDLYTLAGDLVRFRYLVESEYVSEHVNTRDYSPPPEIVDQCATAIALVAERLIRSGGDSAVGVRDVATAISNRFRDIWLDRDHRDRLDARYQVGRFREPNRSGWDLDWLTLTAPLAPSPTCVSYNPFEDRPIGAGGTGDLPFPFVLSGTSDFPSPPFAPAAWGDFDAAVTRLKDALHEHDRPVFRLGEELAKVQYPFPSSYDRDTDVLPLLTGAYLARVVVPGVRDILCDVQSSLGVLAARARWWDGPDLRTAMLELNAAARGEIAVAAGVPAECRPVASGRPNPTGPRWDAVRRCLYFREKLVKGPVAHQATYDKYLELFQEGRWLHPVKVDKSKDRRETLRGLNTDLEKIEFVGTERASEIFWRLRPGATSN